MASARKAEWVAEVNQWVVDFEKSPGASSEATRCGGHSIYRVPEIIRDLNSRAYQPQVVSLGPFHHGKSHLLPMEEHKQRALVQLLRRAEKPFDMFVDEVEKVVECLDGAYQHLGGEWWGENRQRFLKVMIMDGCFLLEVMRMEASGPKDRRYAVDDPIFSKHGFLYSVPFIRRDMLMIENQLPLLVLQSLVAVESGKEANENLINRMVMKFLAPTAPDPTPGFGLGLHPLDIYRRSLLYDVPNKTLRPPPAKDGQYIIRSAMVLREAGIRFKRSKTGSLRDASFHSGVLQLPMITVDDDTEYVFLNMMAFERLHVGAGNEVTAYVFFMDTMMDTANDVELLTSMEIVQNSLGSSKAVANLFHSLSRDAVLDPGSVLEGLHQQVNAYYRKPWRKWRAMIVHNDTYFRSPWAFFSLTAAVSLFVLTVLQTIYTIMQYNQGRHSHA